VNTTKVKLISATAGVTGVLAMGAVSVAFSGTTVAEPSSPGPVPTPSATIGETSTEATPAPSVPTTSLAVPPIEGPAPLPSEEEGLPG
jgi:hypothetical protein